MTHSWDYDIELTNKEQRQYDNLENLEEEHEADTDWDRYYALSESLVMVFDYRTNQNMETATAITNSTLPDDISVCDDDRQAEAALYIEEVNVWENDGSTTTNMENFFLRIELWIEEVATQEAAAAAAAEAAETTDSTTTTDETQVVTQ